MNNRQRTLFTLAIARPSAARAIGRLLACAAPIALALGAPLSAAQQPEAPAAPGAQKVLPTTPGAGKAVHETLIKPRDAVLVVGDDFVLASAWPRMFEAGLLRVRPTDRIRFFNAGWPGATIGEPTPDAGADSGAFDRPQPATLWLQRLIFTARPTIVLLAFGQSDALAAMRAGLTPNAFGARFEKDLDSLVTKTLALQVRAVALVSPPAAEALPSGAGERADAALNDYLRAAHEAAVALAARRSLVHIDAFTPSMNARKKAAERGATVRFTADGAVPNALGSLVAAGAALRDLGVAAADLSRLGWAPAPMETFDAAKPYLPADIRPDAKQADTTFGLVQMLAQYDDHFDLLWRQMEMRLHPAHARRADLLTMHRLEVENNWRAIEEFLNPTPAPEAKPKPAKNDTPASPTEPAPRK